MAKRKNNGQISKTGAVRAALKEGITDNPAIIAFAKEKHGIDILPKHLSVIKSSLKTKVGAPTGNGRRKPKAKKEVEATATSLPSQTPKGDMLGTLRAVSDLAQKVGGIGQLRELVDVLASVK